jgi:hypothetical protein
MNLNEETKHKAIVFSILGFCLFVVLTLNIKQCSDREIDKKNSEISAEQLLETTRIVEKNEKWFEGYKQGQIDAIRGYIDFELKKNENGEVVWEFNPKKRISK